MLKKWRKSHGMNLEQAAAFLGLKSASHVFYLEGGRLPAPETIAQIEGATMGEVTFAHLWAAWRKANPQKFLKFRAAGRAAAKEHRVPAKLKPKPRSG